MAQTVKEKREYAKRYRRERMGLLASDRLDVLEPPPPPKGCNALIDGKRCRRLVVRINAGPFSVRRLCAEHSQLYFAHDRMLWQIRQIPERDTRMRP